MGSARSRGNVKRSALGGVYGYARVETANAKAKLFIMLKAVYSPFSKTKPAELSHLYCNPSLIPTSTTTDKE
jgi:hypothetical protein